MGQAGTGDTLLKQDGVEHGCVYHEDGILADFFKPMSLCFSVSSVLENSRNNNNLADRGDL
jgi:hypothetical protein